MGSPGRDQQCQPCAVFVLPGSHVAEAQDPRAQGGICLAQPLPEAGSVPSKPTWGLGTTSPGDALGHLSLPCAQHRFVLSTGRLGSSWELGRRWRTFKTDLLNADRLFTWPPVNQANRLCLVTRANLVLEPADLSCPLHPQPGEEEGESFLLFQLPPGLQALKALVSAPVAGRRPQARTWLPWTKHCGSGGHGPGARTLRGALAPVLWGEAGAQGHPTPCGQPRPPPQDGQPPPTAQPPGSTSHAGSGALGPP